MSPNGSSIDPTHQKTWRSIRPWNPPLSLVVREITSVSVTFILSSTLGVSSEDDALDQDSSSDDDDLAENVRGGDASISMNGNGHSNGKSGKGRWKGSVIPLDEHELTVHINGSEWNRFICKLDDKTDDAVIIIYGFMPGKQYDVVLGIVRGGQSNTTHGQLITDDSSASEGEFRSSAVEPTSSSVAIAAQQTSAPPPAIAAQSRAGDVPPNDIDSEPPPVAPPPLTFDEYYAQLQQKLTAINEERDALTAKLKSARKEAQKADATVRSEIEALKRGSEKHAASENRAKQKLLSLQEMVKRTQTMTRDTEQQIKETEASLPELNKKEAEKENEHKRLKEEAANVRKEREMQAENGKKKLEGMKNELAALKSKVERLNAKKDKLETSVLPDLEQQLKKIESEITTAELESKELQAQQDIQQAQPLQVIQDVLTLPTHPVPLVESQVPNGLSRSATDGLHQQSDPVVTPSQRPRALNLNPGPISRPAPIQRPTLGEVANITPSVGVVHHGLWSSQNSRQLHQLPALASVPPPVAPAQPAGLPAAGPQRSGQPLVPTNDAIPFPLAPPPALPSHTHHTSYHPFHQHVSSQSTSFAPTASRPSNLSSSSSSSSSQSSPRDKSLGSIAPPPSVSNPITASNPSGVPLPGIHFAGNSTLPLSTTGSTTGSTLSSRAPPFEPGKPLKSSSGPTPGGGKGLTGTTINVPPHLTTPPGLTLQKSTSSTIAGMNANMGSSMTSPYHYQRSPRTSLTGSNTGLGGLGSGGAKTDSGVTPQITIMQRPPGASRNLLAVGSGGKAQQQSQWSSGSGVH